MSDFTEAYVSWAAARADAGVAPHALYVEGRGTDIDLTSAIAQLTPLLRNSIALTDAALCDVIKLATPDERAALAAAAGGATFANCLGGNE